MAWRKLLHCHSCVGFYLTSLIASHLQTEHKIQYILSRPTKMPIQIEFLFTIIGSTLYIFEPSLCHKTALKFFLFCEQPSLNIKKTFSLPLFLSKIQLYMGHCSHTCKRKPQLIVNEWYSYCKNWFHWNGYSLYMKQIINLSELLCWEPNKTITQ